MLSLPKPATVAFWVFCLLCLQVVASEAFDLAGTAASSTLAQRVCLGPVSCLAEPQCFAVRKRHEDEREHLLRLISIKIGDQWNDEHHRWHILEALYGFDRYKDIVGAEITRFELLYRNVPREHHEILEATIKYNKSFEDTQSLLGVNAVLCKAIVENALEFYKIGRYELDSFIRDAESTDQKWKERMQRVLRLHTSQALKHMVRDWALDGSQDRAVTFPYILDALHEHVSSRTDVVTQYHVLVPGAALGRLAHEISQLGSHVSVTSNERDAYMNLAYRYIATLSPCSHLELHPFIESWSHARTRNDFLRAVNLPETAAPLAQDNVLIEGDFMDLPHDCEQYDAVPTLFFIDTAKNLVAYLQKIHCLLKPGGLWINVGPLLYGSAPYVQLSVEEIVMVAEAVGFTFEDRRESEVLYDFNASPLYRNAYMAQFWVAKKTDSLPKK